MSFDLRDAEGSSSPRWKSIHDRRNLPRTDTEYRQGFLQLQTTSSNRTTRQHDRRRTGTSSGNSTYILPVNITTDRDGGIDLQEIGL